MTGWGFSARTKFKRQYGRLDPTVRNAADISVDSLPGSDDPALLGRYKQGMGGGGLCVRFGKEIQDHLPCQLEPRRDRIPQGMRSQVRLRQGLIRPARGGSLPSGVYQPGISIPDRDSRTVLNAGRHERSKQAFLFHFFRAWNDPFPGCLILHRTVSRTVFISNMPD